MIKHDRTNHPSVCVAAGRTLVLFIAKIPPYLLIKGGLGFVQLNLRQASFPIVQVRSSVVHISTGMDAISRVLQHFSLSNIHSDQKTV